MILQIIDLMRALDYVQGSSLSAAEKRAIALELRGALPAKALCHGAHVTHEIADAAIDKVISDNTVRNNGPATGESPGQTRKTEENRKEGHQQSTGSKGSNVLPGANRKALGSPQRVAKG